MLPQATSDLYDATRRRGAATALLVRSEWEKIDPAGDWWGQWLRLLPRAALIVGSSRVGAATDGVASVPAALEEFGSPSVPVKINPKAFAGWAGSGVPLVDYLSSPVRVARDSPGSEVERLAAGRSWLEGLTRTAVSDAARGGSSVAIAATPRMGYTRYESAPYCQRCAPLVGKWFRWNQGFQRHPRCFPAGVVISGPRLDAATRRRFQGELVVLTTQGGEQLPVTGNHPILTTSGWVPAHLINEGCYVVRSTSTEGASALVVPNHDQVPALIEDVWSSLSVGGFDRVPSSPEDFHGDGGHGEVNIVRADRPLRNYLLAARTEHRRQCLFGWAAESPLLFKGESSSELVDHWLATQTRGSVSGRRLRLPLVGRHLGCPNEPSFAETPARDASVSKPLFDDGATDPVFATNGTDTTPGLVRRNDLVDRKVFGLPRWDAPGDSFSMETRDGYARLGRDLLQRLSGQVELDRVIKVSRVEWSGHVYSLTSSEGWHVANGLIVSNCDAVHVPAAQDSPPEKRYTTDIDASMIRDLTEAQRKAIEEGADLYRVLNAYRGTNSDSQRTSMFTTREASRGARRPTPEGIYARAGDDREKALALLRQHGYLR